MAGSCTVFPTAPDSADEQVLDLLQTVRRHLRMEIGFVSEFVAGRRVFRYTDVATRAAIHVGQSDPLDDTYCGHVVAGRLPGLLPDTGQHPLAAALPVTHALPVGSHLSVPITLSTGRVYGTLCCFSSRPEPSLNERDLDVLRMCADMVAQLVERGLTARAERDAVRTRIGTTIERRGFTTVFQPIYRLDGDRLMGFEALTRFGAPPVAPPDRWFAEAASVGLGADLEAATIGEALRALPTLPRNTSLSLNMSAPTLLGPSFAAMVADQPLDRLILELTEHSVIENYGALNAALAPVRRRGLRLAIDDVGAGHSSFRHVLDLQPDLIKLDMSLTRGIDTDPFRRALAESITRFSRRMGCGVVAEGVETVAELDVLRDVGVTKVQGYLTGRPVALAEALRLPLRGGFEGALEKPDVRMSIGAEAGPQASSPRQPAAPAPASP